MRNFILSAGLAMVVAQATTVGWPQAQDIGGSLDLPQTAAEFDRRVRRYVALHGSLEGTVPTVSSSDDYATVLAAIDALAEKIRLEYRFLDRDLILWDSHANIIVDFIKGALP